MSISIHAALQSFVNQLAFLYIRSTDNSKVSTSLHSNMLTIILACGIGSISRALSGCCVRSQLDH